MGETLKTIIATEVTVGQIIGHDSLGHFVPFGVVQKISADDDVLMMKVEDNRFRRYKKTDQVTIPE